MKLAYDYFKSLLLINKNLTKDIFIAETGAKSGYALDMFSRMYDSVTSGLINLDLEYEKYYSFEYPTLGYFLYRKYNFDNEDILDLIEERKKYPECVLYRSDDLSYGDNGELIKFAFSEEMCDRIFEICNCSGQYRVNGSSHNSGQ